MWCSGVALPCPAPDVYLPALSLSRKWLTKVSAQLIMQSSSGFHRRVLMRVRSFPHRLLDLVQLPASQFCSVRQNLAKELHQTDSSKLEFNARKFKLVHARDIASLDLT